MTTEIKSEKEKRIFSKAWAEITPEDLRYLYIDLNYLRSSIATAFGVTIKQVEYKLRKYGLSKLKKWSKESLREAFKRIGDEEIEKMIFHRYDMPEDPDDTVIFGPVIVREGEYKGSIGFLDDIEDDCGIVLWGNGPTALDSATDIPLAYLSNQITTYDLIKREKELAQSILDARWLRLVGEDSPSLDDYLVELYGEYTFVTKLLSDAYATANFLQGEGDKTVFISHASQDTDISLLIATDLKRSKYNVWFDKWDINLGHSIPQAISDGLDSADALIIVLSNDYLRSAFCTDEWQSYYMKFNFQRKPILIIIVDDSKPPTILASRKYHRMKSKDDYYDMLIDLKLALSKM